MHHHHLESFLSSNYSSVMTAINSIIIHKVGNKGEGEPLFLSQQETKIDEDLKNLLTNYFLDAFKYEEYFRFRHDIDVNMNEVFHCARAIFEDPNVLLEQSKNIAQHLYNNSTHPKIKGGELYITYFENCSYNGEMVDAIGIFKSENKDIFLELTPTDENYLIQSREGINIHKLDKGCIIYNIDEENGFVTTLVDNTNKSSEAQYWRDDFLHVLIINNDYHQTHQFLSIAKNYVTEALEETFEVTKADKIDFLNKSVEYFKTHESFDKEEFEEEVFGDTDVIESFRQYDQNYRSMHDIQIEENFEISAQAVKRQARIFKSVLKLDKNFHIYIHGDKELIEKGVDDDGRKFYKIYYENEL